MWYAVQVFTGEERNTILLCKVLVEECFLEDIIHPQKEVMKKYNGAWHKRMVSMFPGYVFAVTDSIDQLYEGFKRVPKLVKLIGTGRMPIALTETETAFVRRITNQDHVAEISVGFIEGNRLTVESGPMMGMEGMVKRIDRHKRTAVLNVEMFGQRVDITLGLEVLKKV